MASTRLTRWLARVARGARAALGPVRGPGGRATPITLASVMPGAYAVHVDLERRVIVVYDLTHERRS